jgi:iron-sulfur cluster protein
MSARHHTTGSPRAVADKSKKDALLSAIRMALRIESKAVRHNTQTFNRNRYAATSAIPDYEALKDRARAIKEHSIANLPELLRTLRSGVERNGGKVFLAKDGEEASRYITEVCRQAGARLVVKGKSMTSEEVHLNHALIQSGIEVAETDLAEFILQVADEQPSHLVGPAIHYSRERITALFKQKFQTERPLDTGEELTAFAREVLREKFLQADAGITGANLIAADSGTLMLVESEGNIRMASLLPPLHITIAGVEKVVSSRADLAPFLELLAASATGQPMTSYTSLIRPPLHSAPVLSEKPVRREFHLVLVDNGRMKMKQDPVLQEALYCIRCGACLNSCANFQTVGGHAFGGETYSGGIGGSWEAGTKGIAYARFSDLCTGCSRCVPQCPVRIDIPWLNVVLRQRLMQDDSGNKPSAPGAGPVAGLAEDTNVPLQKLFFGRYDLSGKWGARFAPVSNVVNRLRPVRVVLEKVFGLDRRRRLPSFARNTFEKSASRTKQSAVAQIFVAPKPRVCVFADIFTNYSSPSRALATLQVLQALGVDVVTSKVSAEGRAALSQGMISTAKRQAQETAVLLRAHMEDGREIIVVEPSVLAMFHLDYRHLLDGPDAPELLARLRQHTFDPAVFVRKVLRDAGIPPDKVFPANGHPRGTRVFFHGHCQQKTIGAAAPTEALLRESGFDVVTSRVECCGMAGSFGYKREYYDLSMAVAADLFEQVRLAEAGGTPRILVTTGISCQEQLQAGFSRPVLHPMELLAEFVGNP